MITRTKMRAGGSEITKLKVLWRDTISDADKDYWRDLFCSTMTPADMRVQVHTRLNVRLDYDNQLYRFREWVEEQDALEADAERKAEDYERMEDPNLSRQEMREKLLNGYYRRALVRDKPKMGRETMRQDLAERRYDLAERRFALARVQARHKRKCDYERALDYCLEEAKKFPEVHNLFQKAFNNLKIALGYGDVPTAEDPGEEGEEETFNIRHSTPNAQGKSQNAPETSNIEHRTSNIEHRTPNIESKTSGRDIAPFQHSGIRSLEFT